MNKNPRQFKEDILVLIDEKKCPWSFISDTLGKLKQKFVHLPPDFSFRKNWNRFRSAKKIILHWENECREGGHCIEEILEIDSSYDVANKIIVLISEPVHSDIVYFSELGVRLSMTVGEQCNNEKLSHDLIKYIKSDQLLPIKEQQYSEIYHEIHKYLIQETHDISSEEFILKIRELLPQQIKKSARHDDIEASLTYILGDFNKAVSLWEESINKNPKFYRAYNNLIEGYLNNNKPLKAYALLEKMHQLNKNHIGRIVQMGEAKMKLNDYARAQYFFDLALNKDPYHNGALNGLAFIAFTQGDIEKTRELLDKSQEADKISAQFNRMGIALVKNKQYKEALDLYEKAQYVLPYQNKGALLFFNIAICYARWGKVDHAKEVLKLALIKNPQYRKAQNLLRVLDKK